MSALRRSASWVMRRTASRSAGVGVGIDVPEPNVRDRVNPANDNDADTDEDNGSFTDAALQGGLTAKVLKCNKRSMWDKRWIELNEAFMVLLV